MRLKDFIRESARILRIFLGGAFCGLEESDAAANRMSLFKLRPGGNPLRGLATTKIAAPLTGGKANARSRDKHAIKETLIVDSANLCAFLSPCSNK